MRTIKGHHDLYLKCDVLLLFHAFAKCRNNSLKNFGLCPSQNLSTPAFSQCEKSWAWTCIYFFETGMRDRVSYISNRYSEANNKYLKSYDPKQESKHTTYSTQIIHMVMRCNLYMVI